MEKENQLTGKAAHFNEDRKRKKLTGVTAVELLCVGKLCETDEGGVAYWANSTILSSSIG